MTTVEIGNVSPTISVYDALEGEYHYVEQDYEVAKCSACPICGEPMYYVGRMVNGEYKAFAICEEHDIAVEF